MNCEKCQKETFLPFRCKYCGGHFCSEHRLPENHECPKAEAPETLRNDNAGYAGQKQQPVEYTITYSSLKRTRSRIRFTAKEVGHLIVASTLVIAVGASLAGFGNVLNSDPVILIYLVAILAMSFLAHEMAHKAIAQKRGLWAEFRLSPIGAALTLLSVVSPIFKIISPGAVIVSGLVDRESMGRISIVGPATNMVLSAVLLTLGYFASPSASIAWIFLVGAAFNAWISLFNLIPFGVLDGLKVFTWSKKVWILAFGATIFLVVLSYRLTP